MSSTASKSRGRLAGELPNEAVGILAGRSEWVDWQGRSEWGDCKEETGKGGRKGEKEETDQDGSRWCSKGGEEMAQAVGREQAGRRCAGGRRAGAGREEMRR
ncbi:hypothetical protein ACLOJK_024516 [Asimina triloba]